MNVTNDILVSQACTDFLNNTMKPLKPIHVDVLSSIEMGKESFNPFTDDEKSLSYPQIINYLHRRGYIFNEYSGDKDSFLKLDPLSGRYYPVTALTLEGEIYTFINYCKPKYSVEQRHISSIIRHFKAEYNLNSLEKEFTEFLGLDGYLYDFCYTHKENGEANLIQLDNGIFHPYSEWEGYPFQLLPNCGLFYPPEGNSPYDLYFTPIPECNIFEEGTPYDDFLTILGDQKSLEFFLWWAGAVLFSYPFRLPMFLLLYGPGGTGKTALANCLMSILGSSGSHADLSCLIDERGRACFIGKKLNLSSEMEGKYDKRLISSVKKLTGGEPIQVDPKFKDAKHIYPPALIFTGNTFPEIDTSDSGILRRACVINCTANLEDTGIDWPRMMKDNEHKNWLFNASYYLWMNNKDKVPHQMKSESMLEMESRMRLFNPLTNWMYEYFGTLDKSTIRQKIVGKTLLELYESYDYFVRDLGGVSLSKHKFSEKIQNDYRLVYKPNGNVRVFKISEE